MSLATLAKWWENIVKRHICDSAENLFGPEWQDEDTPKPCDVFALQSPQKRLIPYLFLTEDKRLENGWRVFAQSPAAACALLEVVDCAHISPEEFPA